MKVLVVGGAGFIGSHLVDRFLAEGHQVDVVDDLSTGSLHNLAEARAARTGRLKIHQVDVRDEGLTTLVEQRHPEVVYLLTGGASDVVDAAAVSLVGGLRVLEGARRAGSAKVVAGVDQAVYGEPPASGLPAREADAACTGTGAAAALGLVGYLGAYREEHGLEFTALAMSTVYGPRSARGVVAAFVEAALAGRPAVVHGDGRQTRDLLFVDDAVDALVRASTRGSGLLVNVGSGVETAIEDLHELVAQAVLGAVEPERGGRATPARGPRRMSLDPARARMQLGWVPWTSVEEGVGQTVAHAMA